MVLSQWNNSLRRHVQVKKLVFVSNSGRTMTLLDETAGATFVGSYISAILFGVTVTQAIHYYQNFPHDIRLVKFAVTLLLILDIAHAALVADGSYIYCVKSIGDPEILQLVPVSFAVQNVLTALSILVVRCTFARRIWYLSNKNRVVTGLLLMMAVASFAVSFTADVVVFKIKTFEQLANDVWIIYASFPIGMLVDICIACSLSFFLYRSSRGFKRTSSLLNTLILYVVGTGLITIIWETLTITLYATSRNTLLFVIFYLSFSKLYINSLLVSLNWRPSRQKKDDRGHYNSSDGSQQRVRIPSNSNPSSRLEDGEFELSSSSKVVSLEVGTTRSLGETTASMEHAQDYSSKARLPLNQDGH